MRILEEILGIIPALKDLELKLMRKQLKYCFCRTP